MRNVDIFQNTKIMELALDVESSYKEANQIFNRIEVQ